MKVRMPGGDTAYALAELPTQQIVPSEHLRRVMREWVVEMAASGNLVVLRTPPGVCARRGLGPRPERHAGPVGNGGG